MCDNLIVMLKASRTLLTDAVNSLSVANPTQSRLEVLLKVLTCEPSTKWATTHHFDRSVPTMIIGSDDLSNESFRIAQFKILDRDRDLARPIRKNLPDKIEQVALVFPGMGMRAAKICDLPPSPHGAVPTAKRRHTLIAFLVDLNIENSRLNDDELNYKTGRYL